MGSSDYIPKFAMYKHKARRNLKEQEYDLSDRNADRSDTRGEGFKVAGEGRQFKRDVVNRMMGTGGGGGSRTQGISGGGIPGGVPGGVPGDGGATAMMGNASTGPAKIISMNRTEGVPNEQVGSAFNRFNAANPLGTEQSTGYRGMMVGSKDMGTGKGSFTETTFAPKPYAQGMEPEDYGYGPKMNKWIHGLRQQSANRMTMADQAATRNEQADLATKGFTIDSANKFVGGQGNLERMPASLSPKDRAMVYDKAMSVTMEYLQDPTTGQFRDPVTKQAVTLQQAQAMAGNLAEQYMGGNQTQAPQGQPKTSDAAFNPATYAPPGSGPGVPADAGAPPPAGGVGEKLAALSQGKKTPRKTAQWKTQPITGAPIAKGIGKGIKSLSEWLMPLNKGVGAPGMSGSR